MNKDAEQRTDSQVKGKNQAVTSAHQMFGLFFVWFFFLIFKMFILENYLIRAPSVKIRSCQSSFLDIELSMSLSSVFLAHCLAV